MHDLSLRWLGCRIQSSQKEAGHLGSSSSHTSFSIIHPSPGKKSVLYKRLAISGSTYPSLPLSFQADTHHRVGSDFSIGWRALKYSKKSGATWKRRRKKLDQIIGKLKAACWNTNLTNLICTCAQMIEQLASEIRINTCICKVKQT